MPTYARLLRTAAPALALAIRDAGVPLLHAQAPSGRALAIEDYYRVKTVGGPELSPDGKWVAFTVSTRVEATNDNTSEVWLAAFDGSSQPKRVSADGANATGPQWLDDGRLRFAANGRAMVLDPAAPDRVTETRRGRRAAAVAAAAGGGRGGRGGGGGGAPMASPDGKWTAVVRDTPPPKREKVYESEFAKRHEERFKGVAVRLDGFPARRALPSRCPTPPIRTSIRRRRSFSRRRAATEQQLTHLGSASGRRELESRRARCSRSPPTRRTATRCVYGRSDIWTVASTGASHELTSGTDYSYAGAQFSPDGNWILATRSTPTDAVIAKKMDNGGPVDIVVLPPNGGRETNLTEDWDYLPSRRVLESATASTSTSPAASAARRISSASSPTGGARRAGDERPAAPERRSATIAR